MNGRIQSHQTKCTEFWYLYNQGLKGSEEEADLPKAQQGWCNFDMMCHVPHSLPPCLDSILSHSILPSIPVLTAPPFHFNSSPHSIPFHPSIPRVNIVVVDRDGVRHEVKGKVGDNVLYLAHRYEIEMEGEEGGGADSQTRREG